MSQEIAQIGIGFALGVLVTIIVVELGFRKISPRQETSRLTTIWSLDEIKGLSPVRIVAEEIRDVSVPPNSTLVLKSADGLEGRRDLKIRINKAVNTNFAFCGDRALIFTKGISPKVPVVWTVNPTMLSFLRSEFTRLWKEGNAVR